MTETRYQRVAREQRERREAREAAVAEARRRAVSIVPPKPAEPSNRDKLQELLSHMDLNEVASALNHVLGPEDLERLRDEIE